MNSNDKPVSISKRHLLKLTAMGSVGAAIGSITACQHQSDTHQKVNHHIDTCWQHSSDGYSCYGTHQAGIVTPHQPFAIMCAFDLVIEHITQLKDYFQILTKRIEFLTQGGELQDVHRQFPPAESGLLGQSLLPDGLSVTVSVGASLFDHRFGLQNFKPKHLQEMKGFPNDKLQKNWCDGDISIQICAFSPETCQNALRDILKNTAKFAVIRWTIDGWLPKAPKGSAPRNLFGYKDGTANPHIHDPKVANQVLWTGMASNSTDEPEWTKNGTYQAVRIIRQFVEFWDRTPLQEQDSIFGREKYSGSPLGGQYEHDIPDYTADPEGAVIPLDSHMRLANPRTKDFLQRHQLYRRPFNYSRGLTQAGQLDVGLILIMYQANLSDGFIFVQNQLNGETLEEYISPFGGGYFFTLAGFEKGHFLGENLLAMI